MFFHICLLKTKKIPTKIDMKRHVKLLTHNYNNSCMLKKKKTATENDLERLVEPLTHNYNNKNEIELLSLCGCLNICLLVGGLFLPPS